MLNLFLNAGQAMPEGGELILQACEENGHWAARIDVIDTGPGVAPEMRDKLFRPFQTTKPGGSGLGLPTVKRIVEAHGGTIDVQSRAGSRHQIRNPASDSTNMRRTMPAGYSGTPLVKKLGIKPGHRLLLVQPPPDFLATLGELPDDVTLAKATAGQLNMALLFVESLGELNKRLAPLVDRLIANGAVWVCWPKRASGFRTDLDENVIRHHGLETGLVDVKVCRGGRRLVGIEVRNPAGRSLRIIPSRSAPTRRCRHRFWRLSRTENNAVDFVAVSLQAREFLSGRDVPNLDRAVPTSGCEYISTGRKGHSADAVGMAPITLKLGPGRQIPQFGGCVPATGPHTDHRLEMPPTDGEPMALQIE